MRKDGIKARTSGGRRLIVGKVFIENRIVESARVASSLTLRSWKHDVRVKSEWDK